VREKAAGFKLQASSKYNMSGVGWNKIPSAITGEGKNILMLREA